MKKVELCIILVVLVVAFCGCNEQQAPKVWGQGGLPADFQGFFGNDNTARLDFVQTQRINQLGQATAELAERVKKLEESFSNDPNDPYEAELRRRGIE